MKRNWIVVGLITVLSVMLVSMVPAFAGERQPLALDISGIGIDLSSLDVGVSALGLLYAVEYVDEWENTDKRRQFDLAANLDLTWNLKKNWKFGFQLQMGPGGGAMGLVGPEVEITDYFIEWADDEKLMLTLGSFDLTFGETTNRLTNNGDATANAFLLNSLFYETLGGPMGTLNVIGIRQESRTEYFDVTSSVINGLDEAAVNSDGNFGGSLRLTGHDRDRRINISGSVVYSDDTEPGEHTGFRTEVFGWLGELYLLYPQFEFGGYYGNIDFNNADGGSSEIPVMVWMGELVYRFGTSHLALRGSGWKLDEDRVSGLFNSLDSITPGLSRFVLTPNLEVRRYQLGYGLAFQKHVSFKAEVFLDQTNDVLHVGEEINNDAYGIMLGLQVTR